MKYAIAIWLFGVAITILCMGVDSDFTVKEKIKFTLWFDFLLALIIAAAVLFSGTC